MVCPVLLVHKAGKARRVSVAELVFLGLMGSLELKYIYVLSHIQSSNFNTLFSLVHRAF